VITTNGNINVTIGHGHDLSASRRTRPVAERELLPIELVVRLDQPLASATEHLERAMIQHAMTMQRGRVERVAQTGCPGRVSTSNDAGWASTPAKVLILERSAITEPSS
jgi:hypothetical protein